MPRVAVMYNVPPGSTVNMQQMAKADLAYQITEGNKYEILKSRFNVSGQEIDGEKLQELQTKTREACAAEPDPAPKAPLVEDMPVLHRFMKPADTEEVPEEIPTNPAEHFEQSDAEKQIQKTLVEGEQVFKQMKKDGVKIKWPENEQIKEGQRYPKPVSKPDPRQIQAWQDAEGRLHSCKQDALISDLDKALVDFLKQPNCEVIDTVGSLFEFISLNKELIQDLVSEL